MKLPQAVWIVGEPGVGKTTLVRALLGRDPSLVPKPKWTIGKNGAVCAAGHYTGGTFDGADTIPYNGVSDVLGYWEANLRETPLTLFDGDRTSNAGVAERVSASAIVGCVYLTAAPDVVAARRAARGSRQNASWVKGRATKSARFFGLFPPEHRVQIDSVSQAAAHAEVLMFLSRLG